VKKKKKGEKGSPIILSITASGKKKKIFSISSATRFIRRRRKKRLSPISAGKERVSYSLVLPVARAGGTQGSGKKATEEKGRKKNARPAVLSGERREKRTTLPPCHRRGGRIKPQGQPLETKGGGGGVAVLGAIEKGKRGERNRAAVQGEKEN